MAYRNILVSMDGSTSGPSRASFAASLAGKFGARLIGAYARSQLPPPLLPPDVIAVLNEAEVRRITDDHAKRVDSAAEDARQIFEAAAAVEEINSQWQVLKDSDELVACTRRTDLLVASAGEGGADAFSPVSLAISGGGPVMVAPPHLRSSAFRRILIAWNGSREAARALRAAWPIIGLADEVDVLIVSRGGLYGPEGMLQRWFADHGVKANVILDDSEDAAAGKILRRQVEKLSPDLVVMGLYGHTRIRELVLGGVSRNMLADPQVPLLLHH